MSVSLSEAITQIAGERFSAVSIEQRILPQRLRELGRQDGVRVVKNIVVEIAAGCEANWAGFFVESKVRVLEILAVLPHLDRRVQYVTLATAHPTAHELVRFSGLAAFPLLQLDNNSVISGMFIATTDHAIDASRTQRQLVLQQDPVVVERCDVEDIPHSAERIAPGVHLRWRWLISVVRKERFAKTLCNMIPRCIADEILGHP